MSSPLLPRTSGASADDGAPRQRGFGGVNYQTTLQFLGFSAIDIQRISQLGNALAAAQYAPALRSLGFSPNQIALIATGTEDARVRRQWGSVRRPETLAATVAYAPALLNLGFSRDAIVAVAVNVYGSNPEKLEALSKHTRDCWALNLPDAEIMRAVLDVLGHRNLESLAKYGPKLLKIGFMPRTLVDIAVSPIGAGYEKLMNIAKYEVLTKLGMSPNHLTQMALSYNAEEHLRALDRTLQKATAWHIRRLTEYLQGLGLPTAEVSRVMSHTDWADAAYDTVPALLNYMPQQDVLALIARGPEALRQTLHACLPPPQGQLQPSAMLSLEGPQAQPVAMLAAVPSHAVCAEPVGGSGAQWRPYPDAMSANNSSGPHRWHA